MAKKTLNVDNLETLGAARLAALLIEISEGNAAAKRRLRLELAGADSPAALAKEVRKRLATIGRSRGFVEWDGIKPLVDDLQTQRRIISERLAKQSATDALELMWRFLDLASPVLDRSHDSSGRVIDVFHAAVADLGRIAGLARCDPMQLADRTYTALTANDYGQFDNLIPMVKDALGAVGLRHLKQRMTALAGQKVKPPPEKERRVIGFGAGGPFYADQLQESSRANTVRQALMDIADVQGDVDGFIAQFDARARKAPAIAARIAERLLAADRANEAWQAIEAAEHRRDGWLDAEWEDARIAVLDALGRGEEAQRARWSCFERALSERHLREYLKRLPDFEDFEAEQRALDYAERAKSALGAVAFLVSWPALDRAARVMRQRAKELDGNDYEILTPAAEALAAKHPLAATLALRAMIDFTLSRARASRYGHAARHLRECAALAPMIADFDGPETHEAYVARLRREHGRKTAFWAQVG